MHHCAPYSPFTTFITITYIYIHSLYKLQDNSFWLESHNSRLYRTNNTWGMHLFLDICLSISWRKLNVYNILGTVSLIKCFMTFAKQVLSSTIGLLFIGKLLEPIWGSREFLKFIFIVNFLTSVCVFITAISLYYVTMQENYL